MCARVKYYKYLSAILTTTAVFFTYFFVGSRPLPMSDALQLKEVRKKKKAEIADG